MSSENSDSLSGLRSERRNHCVRRFAWAVLFLGFLGIAELPAAVDIQLGLNFTGSTSGVDVSANPADANGTIGPAHYVEFINGRFAVYNKNTGARVLEKTDEAFWNAAGVTLPAGFSVSDPRLIFDPTVGRWFAAQIDYNTGSDNVANRFLLAVSTTADPTAAWRAVAFVPSTNSFTDFPTLGINADAVLISGLLFDLISGGAQGSVLVSIPKADLLKTTPTAANRTVFTPLPEATHGFILQPAVRLDATVGDATVIAIPSGNVGTDLQTNLVRFTVHSAAAAGAATLSTPVPIPVPAFSVPINPPQPNNIANLDDGDSRFSAVVCHVGNLLYAVHGNQISNRAALQWYKLNAAAGTLLQSGTITDTNLHLFYPSIAANTNGQVVIAFNACSPTTFVSSYAVAGDTVQGVTTFGPLVLLKAGVTTYNVPETDGTSRWGDYSAINVDPTDPSRFWTIQMVVTAINQWSIQITELRLVVRPALSLTRTTNAATLTLRWPATAASFHLEANTNLALPAAWTPFPQSPVTNAGNLSVTFPPTGIHQFFRLKSP